MAGQMARQLAHEGVVTVNIGEKVKQHLIPDAAKAHKLRSVQVASFGAVAGALAAGLGASGMAAAWFGSVPNWVVFAGGSLICALTVAARLWKQGL